MFTEKHNLGEPLVFPNMLDFHNYDKIPSINNLKGKDFLLVPSSGGFSWGQLVQLL